MFCFLGVFIDFWRAFVHCLTFITREDTFGAVEPRKSLYYSSLCFYNLLLWFVMKLCAVQIKNFVRVFNV